MRKKMTVTLLACSMGTMGCTIGERDLKLPEPAEGHVGHFHGYVAVLSGEMPDPIDQVSRHAWIVVHVPGENDLLRCEYLGSSNCGRTSDAFSYFGEGNVALAGYLRTNRAAQSNRNIR